MKKSTIIVALAVVLAGVSVNSYAVGTTFEVSANVTAVCTITALPLSFGPVNLLNDLAVDGGTTLAATCTKDLSYTVGLSKGYGADVSHRVMKHTDGTHTLGYSLSTVSPGGTNWDDIGGATVKAGTGSGLAQTIDVFGQINSGQKATAIVGDYSDTITATVDF